MGLVTGSASGLGRATAQRLVREGGKVVVADLPFSKGEELVQELGADNAIFAPVNVSPVGFPEAYLHGRELVPAKTTFCHVETFDGLRVENSHSEAATRQNVVLAGTNCLFV